MFGLFDFLAFMPCFPEPDKARLYAPPDGIPLGGQRLFVMPSEERIVRGPLVPSPWSPLDPVNQR